MKRRKFITTAASATAAALLPFSGMTEPFPANRKKGFNVLMLGDIHFDKMEHHDIEYVKTHSRAGKGEFSTYCRITRDNFPTLMEVVKEQSDKQQSAFILQLGDFVQGMCGSKELANKQVNDFIAAVKAKNFNRPFMAIKGNHDIAGEGAVDSYLETVLPWQAGEMKRPVKSANISFVHQNARFILFDCYSADSLDWLQEALKDYREEILFFCCHVPIVPFDERSNLYQYYGNPAKRSALLDLLGKHRAIVLCGHLHKTCLLTRETSQGNFVQVSICSIIRSLNAPVKDELKGLDAYNADLVNLKPGFSVASMPHRRELLTKEKPFIRYYEYANYAGYSMLNVKNNKEVILSIYQNVSKEPRQRINLIDLLNA